MKAYGIDNKLRKNYRDNHPLKMKNWWEHELKKVVKARERRKNKIKEIEK